MDVQLLQLLDWDQVILLLHSRIERQFQVGKVDPVNMDFIKWTWKLLIGPMPLGAGDQKIVNPSRSG